MILDFADTTAEGLGEALWVSFISARLAREDALRDAVPCPEWHNQDEDTKALWRAYGARLRALYEPRV